MNFESLKISLLYLTLLLISISAFGQQEYYCAPKERLEITTNPKYPINNEYHKKINDLDWTKDSFKINSYSFPNNVKYISPFFQSDNPGVQSLVFSKDMMPIDGWELIDYDFGYRKVNDSIVSNTVGWPYFILYNKYKGVLRNFIMLQTQIKENYSYLIDFIGQYDDLLYQPFSSILINLIPLNSLDDFNDYTSKNYYLLYSTVGFWNWGDVNVIYDPCSCQNDNLLNIEVNIFRYRDIEIDGKKGYEYSEYLYATPTFGVPGTIFGDGYKNDRAKEAWYPYYNNILGTFNLLRTPEINYSSRFNNYYEYEFKLSKDLEYVVNPAAGFVMDSIDLKVRYVIEFSKFPAINTDDNLFRINDSTYESNEIPIGCFKDYTLRFKTPFSETPRKVYLKLSGNFIKIEKKGKTPDQYLDLTFKVNLTNYKLKTFEDNYWNNEYYGDCNKSIIPYNLNYNKMNDFCTGKEYINTNNYSSKRNYRKIIDTVEKTPELITETRLYDLYPNPAKDKLNIEFAIDSESNIKFYLIDELGKLVQGTLFSEHKERGKYSIEIQLQGIAQGIYFGILESNNRKDIRKVAVIR